MSLALDSSATLAQADILLTVADLVGPDALHPDTAAGGSRLSLFVRQDAGAVLARARVADAEAVAELMKRLEVLIATDYDAWSAEHTRLFDGPTACPVTETAYVRRDKGHVIADICGFYRAFGVGISEDAGEKADHLAAELEYMAILLVKLAEAHTLGLGDAVEVTRAAFASFAHDHLGEWLPGFCERLAHEAQTEAFLHLASILGATWQSLCAYHGVKLSEATLEPVEDAGSPYECGMADAGLA